MGSLIADGQTSLIDLIELLKDNPNEVIGLAKSAGDLNQSLI